MGKAQKPKPGKVVRLKPELQKLVEKHQSTKESWSDTIMRLIGSTESLWTLPSKLYGTKSAAKGVAVQEAAKQGLPLEQVEQPIKVGERY